MSNGAGSFLQGLAGGIGMGLQMKKANLATDPSKPIADANPNGQTPSITGESIGLTDMSNPMQVIQPQQAAQPVASVRESVQGGGAWSSLQNTVKDFMNGGKKNGW